MSIWKVTCIRKPNSDNVSGKKPAKKEKAIPVEQSSEEPILAFEVEAVGTINLASFLKPGTTVAEGIFVDFLCVCVVNGHTLIMNQYLDLHVSANSLETSA